MARAFPAVLGVIFVPYLEIILSSVHGSRNEGSSLLAGIFLPFVFVVYLETPNQLNPTHVAFFPTPPLIFLSLID